MRTAALSLVYSTAEYCAPVWCRSAHTRLIDRVLNDALRIVIGCLRPTPSVYLPVLSGIQPAELRRQGATLSLANRSCLDPDHILHGQFHESQDVCRERLKSRRSFVPAARKLLDSLSEMDFRAAQWTNTKWDMEYSANASSLHVFIPKASTRPLGMGLPRAAWVKPSGRTRNEIWSTLLTHRHSTLSFPRLAPDPWVWVCPGLPGSSSSVCVLVLDVSVRPCTNGVSLF